MTARRLTNKLTIWQEIRGDDMKANFCVYKNGEIVKTSISSLDVEDLRKLCHMADGLSHKLWHVLHFKLFKCCPVCNIKKREKK